MDQFFTSIIESIKLCGNLNVIFVITIGMVWGTIAGALPGVGPNLALGVVLPFTFIMTPVSAVAFLVSINVACSYGNSIPAILIGVPGTSAAVLTAKDGYALHRQGKSGLALGVQFYAAVMGSFLSIFFFFAMVVPLARLTYVLLTPELFALYFLGVTACISITGENIIKGLIASAIGLSFSMVGRDPVSASSRFVFFPETRAGVDTTAVVMGLVAVSELFRQARQSFNWSGDAGQFKAKFPPVKVLWGLTPGILIGCAIGTIVGAIPGLGGNAAAFISYNQAKMLSKTPELFGHGSIEGIAANESAQNASQAGEMVPTFGLGIPGSSTMVLLLSALLMHGLVPGPLLIKQAPHLLYASGAGLIGCTVLLAVTGWPQCMILYKVVTLDRAIILTGALALCVIGVFSMNSSVFDVFVMILFGVIGYFMQRYGYSNAAAAIALILGDGLEANLRRGLIITHNSYWDFFTRPWVATIMIIAVGLLAYGAIGTLRLARQAAAYRRLLLAEHLAKESATAQKD